MKTPFDKNVQSNIFRFAYSHVRCLLLALMLFSFSQSLFAQGLGPIPEYDPALRPDIFVYRHQAADFVFENSELKDISLVLPTAIDFGPDDRLYIGQKNGLIIAYNYVRNGSQDYQVVDEEKIFTLKVNTTNHDDDGSPNTSSVEQEGGWILDLSIERQLTGILIAGTAENPVIYATSSDPRAGGGGIFHDSGLDTNSGIIHRITKENGTWKKIDLVRGLPRNEENHSTNGLQLDEANNILYVASGGMTNAGGPSNNFALTTEYALSAAILKVDLNMIDAMPVLGEGDKLYVYDLPTLDDPTRANANGIDDPNADGYDGIDINDPFGGNNGLNQAKLVLDGPVQLHATGFRNAYDIALTKSAGREGRLYTVDNGANQGWGGFPMGEDEYPGGDNPGTCTNNYDQTEPGSTTGMGNDDVVNNMNGLHFIREIEAGFPYYAGHPAPIRGNPAGAGLYTSFDGNNVWRTSTTGDNPLPADWPPVPVSVAYAAECDFRNSGIHDGAIANYGPTSINGISEFNAGSFGGEMRGSLIMANMSGDIYIAQLNEAGDQVINGDVDGVDVLFPTIGGVPLDLAVQNDDDPFPGTIWITGYLGQEVTVFEPQQSNVAVEDEEGLPDSFTLYGNYPNPFSQTTSVILDLPQPAAVNVEVYDMLGRMVYKSPEQSLPAGASNALQLSGADLASGRYVYRVTAHMPHKTISKSGRMAVLK
ncbi:MAG: T9SS type A sorting domain-containing protein [Rhodothermales bacterium]